MTIDAFIDETNTLHYDGVQYHVTPTQRKLLELLLTGRVISVGLIEDALWPIDADWDRITDVRRLIHVHIHQLRKQVPFRIEAIPKVGWQMHEPEDEWSWKDVRRYHR